MSKALLETKNIVNEVTRVLRMEGQAVLRCMEKLESADAEGEAARFLSVLEEYQKAPEVTRERLYLEMIEDVFSSANIILLDENSGGAGGVVPYLPLDQLRTPSTGGSN